MASQNPEMETPNDTERKVFGPSADKEVRRVGKTDGKPASPETLIVLGMHRSGTSALTGALALCGARVGADEDLTPAAAQNPKGFWERRDMRALCNQLLSALGAEWWRVAGLDLGAAPPEALAEAHAAWAEIDAGLGTGLGRSRSPDSACCCLFCALRYRVRSAFTVHRHPLEVARSPRGAQRLRYSRGLSALGGIYATCPRRIRRTA